MEPSPSDAPSSKANDTQQQELHSLSHAYSTYLAHDVDEKQHWEDVCRAFRQYASFSMAQWANHQYRLHALPEEQRRFFPAALRRESPEFQQRAKLYKEAAIRNQFCLDCILRHAGQPNSQDVLHSSTGGGTRGQQQQSQRTAVHATDSQMSKVSSVLKSLARDWSAEGRAERDMAYQPILETVQRYLPIPTRPNHKKRARPSATTDATPLPASSLSPSSVTPQTTPSSLSSESGSELNQTTTVETTTTTTTTKTLPPPRLCVPGAGVGRLACELAARGYAVQGNEFSLYMLLASDFILNGGLATPAHPLQISPYLLESRNVHVSTDPLRPLQIPDVDPYKLIVEQQHHTNNNTSSSNSGDGSESEAMELSPSSSPSNSFHEDDENGFSDGNQNVEQQADFSMAAGEFVSIYGNARERGKWDGFVACFFMDTAPSIIEYITVMHKALKMGGLVFHFGPLLWHWSGPAMRPDDRTWESYQGRYNYLDKKYMSSLDLAWSDVKAIFINVGFEIVEEKVGVNALYTSDKRSMMNMSYNCIQFIARKTTCPLPPLPPSPPVPAPTTTATALNTLNSTASIPSASNLPVTNRRDSVRSEEPRLSPPTNRQGSTRSHNHSHNTRNNPKAVNSK